MADYVVNKTALETVNIVLRRLGVDGVATLDENDQSIVATDLLNDVLDDVSDAGNWPQMYTEITVQAQASVGEYKLDYNIKNIYEIAWNGLTSPMQVVSLEDIRRLQRLGTTGIPRRMCVVRVSGGVAPVIRVHPLPTSADSFNVAYYQRPQTIRASAGDGATVIPYPSRVVVQGLYAVMLLEENGGQQTNETIANYKIYTDMKRESINRFVGDTGTDIQFVPTGGVGR